MTIFIQIRDFFASVRLAVFTLCLLALTSIIGTVIPQNQPQAWYIAKYGEKTAAFFQFFDIDRMYSSWWFCSLLTLLAVNLIVCSIHRFPLAWQQIQQDNTALPCSRIYAMNGAKIWQNLPKDFSFAAVGELLTQRGWQGTQVEKKEGAEEDAILYFSQKGRWSRLGVYLVHLSILLIFLGAVIGSSYGFRASVFIAEGEAVDTVYSLDDRTPIPLGFSLHCSSFQIEFYPPSIHSAMPKEYTSRLAVLKDGETAAAKTIEVNSPLTYQGITFYQSSFQPLEDFFISIEADKKDGRNRAKRIFAASFRQEIEWQEEALRFGILNVQAKGDQAAAEKLWIKAADSPAKQIIFTDNSSREIELGGKKYRIAVKQRYATGLQATKDPGVWLVYLGCMVMLAGLYMAFFMSHQRLWLLWDKPQKKLILSGSSNKNRDAFQQKLQQLQKELTGIIQK